MLLVVKLLMLAARCGYFDTGRIDSVIEVVCHSLEKEERLIVTNAQKSKVIQFCLKSFDTSCLSTYLII